MAPFNHAASQYRAHLRILRWGGAGKLIRGAVERAATMGRMDYSPRERGLFQDGAERIIVSAWQLATPPDQMLDVIEFKAVRFKIVAPVTGPRPNDIVMFYDCSVLRL